MKDWAEVLEIVHSTRRVYLTTLRSALGSEDTEGACFYGAGLLAELLKKFGGVDAKVCGGDGVLDGGYQCPDGSRHGHYWVEFTGPDGLRWLACITSDQFGGPPVVVHPAADARSTYIPGDQTTVDEHVREHWVSQFGSPSSPMRESS